MRLQKVFAVVVTVWTCLSAVRGQRRLDELLYRTLDFAQGAYNVVLNQDLISAKEYPHTGQPTSITWDTTDYTAWTAGFFPGVLWQLYRLTLNRQWSQAAIEAQVGVRPRENDTGTHDVGFVIMSSYGLGLRSGFGNEQVLGWRDTVVRAAHSLCTRFVPNAGVLRSWNSGNPGEVTVIVDNMMNLDLLFQAAAYSGNQTFIDIAKSHADRTIENHFRVIGNTYHVVAYSEADGSVLRKYTAQGYDDESTWSRGQAWALLGFAETYEWTRDPKYLDVAIRAGNFFYNRLPEDLVPYWDYDAAAFAAESYQPRDTSAGSIAALGLLKIYLAIGDELYLTASENIIESILLNYSSRNSDIPAISINGTVFFKQNNYDTAIIYGDFYLLKYMEQYFKLI